MRKRKVASVVAYVLIFAIAIALFNGTTSFAAETIASGACGQNATWTLDSDGLLVISGSGETRAFQCDEGVWSSYKNKVKRVVIEDGITDICSGMFKDCVRLTYISIPNSVLAIGVGANNGANGGAFEGCVKLGTIVLPSDLTSIEYRTFYGCSSLGAVEIPNSVTKIGSSAFHDCSSLISVVLPDGLLNIDDYLFAGCSSLKNISIPKSVVSIGSGAFKDCIGLETVVLPENITSLNYGTFDGCSNLSDIHIPSNVVTMGDYVFRGCSSLKEIEIPDSVPIIGYEAFKNCIGLNFIEIPDSVAKIEGYAFSGCSSLSSVTIPDSVASIGSGAFSGCSSLISIEIPESIINIEDATFCHCSNLESMKIPDTVIRIGGSSEYSSVGAFEACSKIKKVELPDNLKKLGNRTFANCSNLESITIPEGVTSIGSSVFEGCSGLESITIPDSVTSIPNRTFSGCGNLTLITLPIYISSIGNNAFSNCRSLTTITIPDNVEKIDSAAFSNCSGLKSITISEGVTSIGEYAFYGCSGLVSVEIPNGVEIIGTHTFYSCNSLTSVKIPNSVTLISDWSFTDCRKLKTIDVSSRDSYAEAWALENGYCVYIEDEGITIGHKWKNPTYTWSEDNKTCTATRVCKNDASHVETETVNAISEMVTPSTCTTPGTTKYTATFGNKDFDTQTKTVNDIPAEGHDWNAPIYTWSVDGKTCTATRVCKNDASHVETETVNATSEMVTPSTCATPGATKYTATFSNEAFATQTKTVNDIPAEGHDWFAPTYTWSADNKTCTATRVCQNDASHVETETVNATSEVATPASCTTPGVAKYTATFSNKTFATQTKTENGEEATGHDWSAPTYSWSADGKTCTATRVCKTDPSHKETETATVANKMVKAKTIQKYVKCKTNGVVQYTATFKNAVFKSQVKKVTIPAHAYGKVTYTWSKDGKTCTATRVCSNNKAHKHTETVKATATVVKKATATAMGQTKYTANFKNSAFKQQTVTKTDIKIAQPMKVASKATSKKPAIVKFAKLRNKNQAVAAKNIYAVSKAQGKVSCKKLSGNAYITVASNGNIVIKKGLKKGLYSVKVRVTAAGGTKYKAGYKDVLVYVQVK